jgi:hypothetical protein
MSKVDALRAMREARYEANRVKRPAASAASAKPKVTSKADPAEPTLPETLDDEAAGDASVKLCGHRNIGNKTCQRPAGHGEKNHRYK